MKAAIPSSISLSFNIADSDGMLSSTSSKLLGRGGGRGGAKKAVEAPENVYGNKACMAIICCWLEAKVDGGGTAEAAIEAAAAGRPEELACPSSLLLPVAAAALDGGL